MKMPKKLSLALMMLCMPGSASADVVASFRDGAPKDTFMLTNTGACATGAVAITLDMGPSAGRLIFDVAAGGAGEQVFQPLEITAGADHLDLVPEVTDGQTALTLRIVGLPPQGLIAFTIDVDDTIGQREITVQGSEMQGSILRIEGTDIVATFDPNARAVVPLPDCIA